MPKHMGVEPRQSKDRINCALLAWDRSMTAIRTRLVAAHAAVLRWLQRRRNAERAAQAKAKVLIRNFGPEDAYRAARQLRRDAESRRAGDHWRRVARAIARMTRNLPDGDPAGMGD
jgi:hypothetical protein